MSIESVIRKKIRTLKRKRKREIRNKELMQALAPYGVNEQRLGRGIVSSRLGCICNRVQKNGNSMLSILLYQIETGKVADTIKARESVPHLPDLHSDSIRELSSYRRMVIVRDPFSRTLSAFLDKSRSTKFQNSIEKLDPTPSGFHRFVKLLNDGHLTSNPHWDLQSKQLIFKLNHYTDIVRFEKLNSEILEFLKKCNYNLGEPHLERISPRRRTHKTDATKKIQHFYDHKTEVLVRNLFQKDFEILGYDDRILR